MDIWIDATKENQIAKNSYSKFYREKERKLRDLNEVLHRRRFMEMPFTMLLSWMMAVNAWKTSA